jgi:23S rRNA G2445 N2-methylase RlmL
MKRHFAFEKWSWIPENLLEQEIKIAKTQEFE